MKGGGQKNIAMPGIETLQPYLIPAAIAVFLVYRALRQRAVRDHLPALLRAGGVVVDVRTPAEFAAGSSPGSLNIPLDELPARLLELDREKPVILCCASGARSGAAADILKAAGFRSVITAGPWQNTL